MVSPKRWLQVSALAAIVIVLGGIIGVMVHAQSEPAPSKSQRAYAAKVAANLGIDHWQVEKALDRAEREMWDEELTILLSGLKDQGILSQEQVNQFSRDWWALPGTYYLIDSPQKGGCLRHRPYRHKIEPIVLPVTPTPTAVPDDT